MEDTPPSLRPPENKNTEPLDTLSDTMTTRRSPLGDPIPGFTDHAISVSLPTWEDNVDYEKAEPRVLDAMQTGYPRFFIHLNIRKVSNSC